MAYTKVGPFTNGSASPPISAAFLNGIETALVAAAAATSTLAPAPSGGDDTAALQPLLSAAQATGGTLALQAGTYRVNLATTQSFVQPRIVGQGENQTILKPTDVTKPVVKMQGGSGSQSGGYLADLTISGPDTGTGIAGLELADVGGVHWDRIKFTGALTDGIKFHITQVGGFTEFCNGQADFDATVITALHYVTDRADESSFHGSGLTGGSTINTTATAGCVIVEANCFPYNAPMSVTIFPHTAGQNLFANRNTSRAVSFYGTLRIENQTGGYVVVGDLAGNTIYHVGERSVLGSQTFLGNLYFARKVYYSGGSTYVLRDTFTRALTLGASTQVPLGLPQGGSALITVNITATNYAAWYSLEVWQNPFNSGGTVIVLGGSAYSNGTGAGTPTFTLTNYGLTIANGAYTSGYTAAVAVTDLEGTTGTDSLRQ